MKVGKREFAREFSYLPIKREQELHESCIIQVKRANILVNCHQLSLTSNFEQARRSSSRSSESYTTLINSDNSRLSGQLKRSPRSERDVWQNVELKAVDE
jgi:hypothetical protein